MEPLSTHLSSHWTIPLTLKKFCKNVLEKCAYQPELKQTKNQRIEYIRQCLGKFELTRMRFPGTKENLIREKKVKNLLKLSLYVKQHTEGDEALRKAIPATILIG
jgi:hypothetical protein